jgi:hypothetical protein
MLPEQLLWSIVVARGRKQGSTGVQDGAGGFTGLPGRVRGTGSRDVQPPLRPSFIALRHRVKLAYGALVPVFAHEIGCEW